MDHPPCRQYRKVSQIDLAAGIQVGGMGADIHPRLSQYLQVRQVHYASEAPRPKTRTVGIHPAVADARIRLFNRAGQRLRPARAGTGPKIQSSYTEFI